MKVLSALALVLLASGCASSSKLAPGRGLFWGVTPTQLEQGGYPNNQREFNSPTWGQIYDEENIKLGPGSYVENNNAIDHPHLKREEEYIESRWVRFYRTQCCAENMQHHMLEVLDLHWYELTDLLNYRPDRIITVYSPADLDEWKHISGHEFWITHIVADGHILLEPAGILFRRQIYGRVLRATMALTFLEMKCHGELPVWFSEGLASYLAEEGNDHLSFVDATRRREEPVLLSYEEMVRHLKPLVEIEKGRVARYNAFLMIWHLSEKHGYDRIQQLLDAVEGGASFNEGCELVYGMSEDELVAYLDPVALGEPTTTMIIPGG